MYCSNLVVQINRKKNIHIAKGYIGICYLGELALIHGAWQLLQGSSKGVAENKKYFLREYLIS